jgi:hypothetical protein
MGFVDAAYLIAGRRYEKLLPCEQSKRLPERSAATTARREAARELNIPERTVRRAYQTASLSPEAQEAAVETGR